MEIDAKKYNYTCYIVAGGPSLTNFNWSLLGPDKFVIAINRAYEVLPNAQIVYFTDKDYWKVHREKMLEHRGQLIRGALNPKNEEKHERVQFYRLTGPHGLETEPGCLRHGHNSTYAALNLAVVHLGFKKVYLLGVDMKWGEAGDKKTSHWHDGHRRIDPESTYAKMKAAYDTLPPLLSKAGVQVYNVSPDSALNTFKKVTFESVFGYMTTIFLPNKE